MNQYIDALFDGDAVKQASTYSKRLSPSPKGVGDLEPILFSKSNDICDPLCMILLTDGKSPSSSAVSTLEVLKDTQQRFRMLTTILQGLPLDEESTCCEEERQQSFNDALYEVVCSNQCNLSLSQLTAESTYETISQDNKIQPRLASPHMRRTIPSGSEHGIIPANQETPSPPPHRNSFDEMFLQECRHPTILGTSQKENSADLNHISQTYDVCSWEYLVDTRQERTGPSASQSRRMHTTRFDSRRRPPISELSTKPLWKRRLTNNQLLTRNIQPASQSIAREQKQLSLKMKSMLIELDYQSLKLKAKQRKVRRNLELPRS
jgi:hypothetical protein